MSNAEPRERTLLLVGHGSTKRQEAGAVLQSFASAIAEQGCYDNVSVGALLGEPTLESALGGVSGDTVVLPAFMCNRAIVAHKVSAWRGTQAKDGVALNVRVLDPVGLNPEIAALALKMAIEQCESKSLEITRDGLELGRSWLDT